MIDARAETALDIDRLPLNDPEVFRMLQSGDTTAVFQLESRGMKGADKKSASRLF